MSEHACSKEAQIGRLDSNMEIILKELIGNGHEGLVKTIPRLETCVNNLAKISETQTSSLAELTKKVIEVLSVNDFKKYEETKRRDKTKIVISSIIGVSSIITAILIKVL